MNKMINKVITICLVLFLLSCESIVDDLNENPNNPTDVSASLMLTGIEVANIGIQSGHPARVAGIWSGYLHGADRQHSAINSYIIDGDSFDQTWVKIYANVVGNGNLVIEKSEETGNNLVVGVTKIIITNVIGTATAVFGDIPFSQIDAQKEFPNPIFDSQTQVYSDLQAYLDEAILALETGKGSIGAAEIYFNGDGSKWLEVAHTLKARFYLETREFDKAYEEASMGISSPANSLMAPHGSSAGQDENLYHQFLAGGRTGDIDSEGTLITQLLDSTHPLYKGNDKTDEEARFNYYFLNVDDPTNITPNTDGTNSAGGIFAVDASFPLVTYQENLLILAEAGLRSKGFDTGLTELNAFREYMAGGGYINPAYLDGSFSLKYDAYIADDFSDGGMLNSESMSSEDALLKEILAERYVAFFGQILGFNDIRRTRTEVVSIQPIPNTGTELPERFIYSQAEINSNTNAPDEIPGIFVKTPINNL